IQGEAYLPRRGGDDLRQLAGAEADLVEAIQPDQRRRRVDGVHDVVERARQRVDVFAIERRDEGPVQPLDDLVGDEVALVLDFLDLLGLVPRRPIGGEHLLEQLRAAVKLVGERLEVVVELLFPRNQTHRDESPVRIGAPPASAQTRGLYQIRLHGRHIRRVYHLLPSWL